MSEYYKKIGSTLCLITQELMYFDTSMRHIASSASSKNMGSRAHFNTMCFLFAGEIMAADANQLQDLRKFLRARDEDSA